MTDTGFPAILLDILTDATEYEDASTLEGEYTLFVEGSLFAFHEVDVDHML